MHIDAIGGPTTALIGLALDASQMRHQAHVTNIANASVANYAPVRIDFGDALARARDELNDGRIGAASLAALTPDVTSQLDAQGRVQNTVEVDTEVAGMTQNTLQYQALMKGLSKHLSILSLAISEGKR